MKPYLTLLIGLSLSQVVLARSIELQISAQPLDRALIEWALQTGYDVSFPVTPSDHITPAVSGSMEPDIALRRLLAGSEFSYCFVNTRTVHVFSGKVDVDPVSMRCPPGMLQRQSGATESLSNTAPTVTRGVNEKEPWSPERIPEVLVLGERTLNMDIPRFKDDAQPYVVFDKAAIVKSGATSTDEFLKKRLTMTSGVDHTAQELGVRGNASSINLRGVGERKTLILIDGRRTSSFAISGTPQQRDINGIPLSAIDHIEVLPRAASGTYGAGATGGVVNIILRRDFSGLESTLTYGGSFDGGATNRRVDFHGGTSWAEGRTKLQFSGNYTELQPLLLGDRDYAQRARKQTLKNDPGVYFSAFDPPLGRTTNIRSVTGENLTLKSGVDLGSSITFVPYGYAGPASDGGAALTNNAGQYNLDLANTAQNTGGGKASLINAPVIYYLGASLRHKLTDQTHGFVDIALSGNRGRLATNRTNAVATIPASAPHNPFQQDVRVTTPAVGADSLLVVDLLTERLVTGIEKSLSEERQLAFYYTRDRSRYESTSPGEMSPAGFAAMRNSAINVFGDPNLNSTDFSTYTDDPSTFSPSAALLQVGTLRLVSSVGNLPAGKPRIIASIEYGHEKFDAQTFATPTAISLTPERIQETGSAYLGITLPIVSPDNATRWIREVTATIEGRYDAYETRGALWTQNELRQALNRVSSVDPTFSMTYQPFLDWRFRASYGTGFLAPQPHQLVRAAPTTVPGAFLGLKDPKRGNELLSGDITIESGGTEGLKPERSEVFSAGAIYSPRWADLRISIDWSRIRERDNIANIPLTQESLNNQDILPEGTIRRAPLSPADPVGIPAIVSFDASERNISSQFIEVLDLEIEASYSTNAAGSFTLQARGTHLLDAQSQFTPSAPYLRDAGQVQALRWKGLAELGWSSTNLRVGWTTRYTGSYWLYRNHAIDPSQGAAKIAEQITHDVFVRWRSSMAAGAYSGMSLQIGAANVFNRSPSFDATALQTGAARYSPLIDPRRATYYITIQKNL
jgi:iron complex outermembrane recepter protein